MVDVDDARRVRALREYQMLDSPPEEVFDNITRLAARIFDAPIALVSLVDENRQWFKSRFGLEVTETPREHAFCDHAIRQEGVFVVSDATRDPRFADNPLVTGGPGIRFYGGAPVRSADGHALGTLCIIDRKARELPPAACATLAALARQVEVEFETRRRLSLLEGALQGQRRHQHEKELLAAMVVHDLRAPLTTLMAAASCISPADELSRECLLDVEGEADRMRRMLTDVLDICLRDVAGLRVNGLEFALAPLVDSVARRTSHLARQREQTFVLELPSAPVLVKADPDLLERVLVNLVTNAIHHGPDGRAITIAVRAVGGVVRVEVRDSGDAIPELERLRIFAPLEHANNSLHRGYGLGLAFARLAIEAHGGTIGVVPNDLGGNCFYFELPVAPPGPVAVPSA